MAEADEVKGSPAVYRNGQEIECWLTDMDGVLVHENQAVPGAAELIQRWVDTSKRFLVLTNNSIFTPRDLAARLHASGLHVPEENIWTSALATAQFLKDQVQGSGSGNRAYTIGEAGLTTALHEAGFILTDQDPDFVVLGETRTYSFEAITMAIRLILAGARFIATNPDATGPSKDGPMPATGAIAALITKATGREPYVVGKPNPMMFRSAMNQIDAHSETTAMIGDRMDTDIIAGMEAGLHTVLVLSGITTARRNRRLPVPAQPGPEFGGGPEGPDLEHADASAAPRQREVGVQQLRDDGPVDVGVPPRAGVGGDRADRLQAGRDPCCPGTPRPSRPRPSGNGRSGHPGCR